VLVVMDGRPLELDWMAEKMPAILWAWKPGEEGGNALADVLFGDYNPGGKLPVTFPRKVGQVPLYYGLKPSGGKSQFWGDYTDCPAGPLYEFGYGLSYTTFELGNLQVSPARVKPGGLVTVTCEVKNTGGRPGDEVVQLYINDAISVDVGREIAKCEIVGIIINKYHIGNINYAVLIDVTAEKAVFPILQYQVISVCLRCRRSEIIGGNISVKLNRSGAPCFNCIAMPDGIII